MSLSISNNTFAVESAIANHWRDLAADAKQKNWFFTIQAQPDEAPQDTASGMPTTIRFPVSMHTDPALAENLLRHLKAEFPLLPWPTKWDELVGTDVSPEILKVLQLVGWRATFVGTCEVCRGWGDVKSDTSISDAVESFLKSRAPGRTQEFYRCYLTKSVPALGLNPKPAEIHSFVTTRQCSPGGQHAYFRAIRAFFNWLYSPASGFNFKPEDNPIRWIKPPKVPAKIMPAQTTESVEALLSHVGSLRDMAIISTLIDSGGRLKEVSDIRECDILWDKHTIKTTAKGGREVLMPFSSATEKLIRQWLTEHHPNGGLIWGINKNGIVSMLRRLERASGIKCNAHTFRRGFASILRRNGVDSLDIMQLGHWRSLRMVQKYTESVTFEDSLKHYEAPMERLTDATGGLGKNEKVPRPRIELGTRGFSVRCSTA